MHRRARALRCPAGGADYALLIFDNHLPHVNGIELVAYARSIPHRKRTLIIVLSASEAESEARRAGADAFLRKPQGVGLLVETVRGLVRRGARRVGATPEARPPDQGRAVPRGRACAWWEPRGPADY